MSFNFSKIYNNSKNILKYKNREQIKKNKEQIRNEIIDFCSLFCYNICGDD